MLVPLVLRHHRLDVFDVLHLHSARRALARAARAVWRARPVAARRRHTTHNTQLLLLRSPRTFRPSVFSKLRSNSRRNCCSRFFSCRSICSAASPPAPGTTVSAAAVSLPPSWTSSMAAGPTPSLPPPATPAAAGALDATAAAPPAPSVVRCDVALAPASPWLLRLLLLRVGSPVLLRAADVGSDADCAGCAAAPEPAGAALPWAWPPTAPPAVVARSVCSSVASMALRSWYRWYCGRRCSFSAFVGCSVGAHARTDA